jgi:hypothetical protein
MISDEILKDKFATDTIRKGVNKIFDIQSDVAHQVMKERTGTLFANLDARGFGITGASQRFSVSVRILKYLRFNDIRSNMVVRGKLHLYNRAVWGVLYGETLPALRYGMTDEIRAVIRKQLEDAGQQLEIKFEL